MDDSILGMETTNGCSKMVYILCCQYSQVLPGLGIQNITCLTHRVLTFVILLAYNQITLSFQALSTAVGSGKEILHPYTCV